MAPNLSEIVTTTQRSRKQGNKTMNKGNIDHNRHGSHLTHEDGVGHEDQPKGGRVGHASGKAAHHPHMEKADLFTVSPARNAHGYGSTRVGLLRHSGDPKAHRVGRR